MGFLEFYQELNDLNVKRLDTSNDTIELDKKILDLIQNKNLKEIE